MNVVLRGIGGWWGNVCAGQSWKAVAWVKDCLDDGGKGHHAVEKMWLLIEACDGNEKNENEGGQKGKEETVVQEGGFGDMSCFLSRMVWVR